MDLQTASIFDNISKSNVKFLFIIIIIIIIIIMMMMMMMIEYINK